MPKPRRTETQTGLGDAMTTFMLTGEWPRTADGEYVAGFLLTAFTKTSDGLVAIWTANRDVLLREWQRRGGVGLPAGERLARMPRRSKWSKPPSVPSSRRRKA
jgi:hypothetical protein